MKQIFLDTLQRESEIQELISSLLSDEVIDVEISYISNFKNAKKLRSFVDMICVNHDISPKWKSRLILICDELNNNAIEYGSEYGDTNIFRFILNRKQVTMSVSDSWRGEYAKKAESMNRVRQKLETTDFKNYKSIRGRGLFLIINQLVDSLEFIDSLNWWLIVKVEKALD